MGIGFGHKQFTADAGGTMWETGDEPCGVPRFRNKDHLLVTEGKLFLCSSSVHTILQVRSLGPWLRMGSRIRVGFPGHRD